MIPDPQNDRPPQSDRPGPPGEPSEVSQVRKLAKEVSLENADIKPLALASYRERLPKNMRTTTLAFDKPEYGLVGVSYEQLASIPLPDHLDPQMAKRLKQVIDLDQKSMREMNQLTPAIPTDNIPELIKMLTSPGARVAVLEKTSDPKMKNWDDSSILAFSLVLTNPDFYPDLHEIPEVLLQDDAYRIIRLFVDSEETQPYFNPGEAIDTLVAHTEDQIARGKRMIAKALTGPDTLHDIWLQAERALRRRRFEDANFPVMIEHFSHNGHRADIEFKWYVNPPITSDGRVRAVRLSQNYAQSEKWVKSKLAWPLARLSGSNQNIACLSGDQDAYRLARIMRNNQIFGVDFNPPENPLEAPNLTPLKGWQEVPQEIDGIFNSSILPDIATREARHARENIARFFKAQAEQLKQDGVHLTRDTVGPDQNTVVHLVLRNNDGASSGPPTELSTAALFLEFIEVARKGLNQALHEAIDLKAEVLESKGSPEFTVFKTSLRSAWEFLLKQQYREDWSREVLRPYTLLSARERAEVLKEQGLWVNWSIPEHNEWIVKQQFTSRARIYDENMRALPYPPTTCVTLATKRPAGNRIVRTPLEAEAAPQFLSRKSYRSFDPESGELRHERDVVVRVGHTATIDLLPWFRHDGDIYIKIRADYPRPIVALPRVDSSTHSGYLTAEQISAISNDDLVTTLQQGERHIRNILAKKAKISPEQIISTGSPQIYFSSPGTIEEAIVSQSVEIQPNFDFSKLKPTEAEFSTAGWIKTIPAREYLRAAQRGGTESSRVEIAVYKLMQSLRESPDMWLGEEIDFPVQRMSELQGKIRISTARELLDVPLEQDFEEVGDEDSSNFLQIKTERFVEVDKNGNVLDKDGNTVYHSDGRPLKAQEGQVLELNGNQHIRHNIAAVDLDRAEPDPRYGYTNDTVSILPMRRIIDEQGSAEYYVGLFHRHDMPGLQDSLGTCHLITLPAYRIPAEYSDRDNRGLPRKLANTVDLKRFIERELKHQFGISMQETGALNAEKGAQSSHTSHQTEPLGGKYFSSAGTIPEAVYPMIAEVTQEFPINQRLTWVKLKDLLDNAEQIRCGHLLTSMYRAAHAVGLLY